MRSGYFTGYRCTTRTKFLCLEWKHISGNFRGRFFIQLKFCDEYQIGYIWWYVNRENSGAMEKITLSLRNASLKKQIKRYAEKRGLTISGIVENYLQNLIKTEQQGLKKNYELPGELDSLLDGIEVNEELQKKEYKSLRNEMYANRG